MNCKPGDLAIVVPPAHPPNRGAIVKVLRAPSAEDLLAYVDVDTSPAWIVETIGQDLIVLTPTGEVICSCRVRVFVDACLRPVSGLPDTEYTDTEQPIKEVA